MSHTGRAPAAAALLGLGLVAASACGGALTAPGLEGSWGGLHIALELTSEGGTLEYDCAHGTIAAGWALAPGGILEGTGEHFQEHGGPVREGEEVIPRPAAYRGIVRGDRMDLTVTLTDSAQVVGTFGLERGSVGRVFKCL